MVKYDLTKVRSLLLSIALQNQKQFGGTQQDVEESVKLGEKNFNSNGYKTLKIMAFQEAATPTSKLTVGTVVGLLNPKPMKQQVGVDANQGTGLTYCIELEA